MIEVVIKADGISKQYRLGLQEKKSDTFVGQVLDMVKTPLKNFKRLANLSKFTNDDNSIFWALKDINFEVRQGEVLGIVGKNGAGKSTLLKILSRITEPTAGNIMIRGRVSSLLEVGTGFHPELTGRENIYMNGTILGMTKKEIDIKFNEIINFSGVRKHIDTPVKFYSSGMKVRLAFSVAAHLEPEILIIDEVLAVGDAEFQKKCLGKMEDVANEGRTVLFVSHNMSAVKSLCTRAILLNNGEIEFGGDVDDVIEHYLKDFRNPNEINENKYISYLNINKQKSNAFIKIGEDLKINFAFKNLEYPIKNPIIKIEIQSEEGIEVASINSFHSVDHSFEISNNSNIEVLIPNLSLNVGTYYLVLTLRDNKTSLINEAYLTHIRVLADSFYKTGKLPNKKYKILIPNSWAFN